TEKGKHTISHALNIFSICLYSQVAPTVQTVEGNMPPSYEEANAGTFSWDDMYIRRVFIRKVYSILMLQLFSTVAVIALFTFWRQFPWNLILLTIFTLSMACMLGFISSFYNTKSVVLCIGITATVCLCVTIFSFQSKIDITSFQGLLFILCMVMFFCAIVVGFVVPFGYVSIQKYK
uniref:Protein lifeguard 2 n=1 Tax=Sinocyclocheilus grahami TaxID=75366 RepID=A0A672QTU5_SINGR